MTPAQLVARLNVLGYTERPHASQPGQFTIGPDTVVLAASGGTYAGQIVRIHFTRRLADPRVRRLQIVGGERLTRLDLAAPLLTSLGEASRQKRRATALDDIPESMIHAVLAIEDRRFYEHAGVDPLRMVGALVTNLIGDRPYLVGGSTLTQQLVKNTLLTPEKTLRRKLTEQLLSVSLEQRLTKAEILELYVNEVYLGHCGSFAIHGVAEAARIFFGKDIANVSLPEAATIAGIIQAPQTYSPFRHPDRARARRDVVLQAMSDAGFASAAVTSAARVQPLVVTSFALEDEAPYFVDVVGQVISDRHPELMRSTAPVVVRTTLDLHLQRLAQRAVRDGLDAVDRRLTADGHTAQAALIATNPRTGEILALVGGRAYGQSQFNRATHARRQPGSVFKPFVYLAATWRPSSVRSSITAPTSPRPRSSTTSRRHSSTTRDSGAPTTTAASTTARSRCAGRWPARATSPPSRSPKWPATTGWPHSGSAPALAQSSPIRQSHSALSKPRRSKWPARTASWRQTACTGH